MIDRDNRTFICSVVYYDIADYSTKSVEVQIRLKEQLNGFTTKAIKNVAVNDRIILDTGDGVAICFLGDPEDALFVAMSLRDAVLNAADQFTDDPLLVRFGINLGPVKLVNDINNRKNIIGDGINVGQRVMSFAVPGEILVSRSYFEVVSCLTEEYAKLFHYLGMRSDKHIRKHEIYSIVRTAELEETITPAESPKRGDVKIAPQNVISVVETHIDSPDSVPALEENYRNDIGSSSSVSSKHVHWWQTKKLAYVGVALGIVLVVILSFVIRSDFRGGEIQSDKTVLSPETQVKSPDEPLPENTQSAENVGSEQTESVNPTPLVSNTSIQQESPVDSSPENSQSAENISPDQTVPPPATLSVQKAILQFAVSPWGEVYVDGKRHGTSPPLTSVSIAPGKHIIEIKNSTLPPFTKTYEIKPDEKLKISHKFQ